MKKIVKYIWMVLWVAVLGYIWYNYINGDFITTLDQDTTKSPYSLYIFIWTAILLIWDLILMYISTSRKKLKLTIYSLIVILYIFYFLVDSQLVWNRDVSILYMVIWFFLSLFGIFSPKKFGNTVSDIVESKWNYSKKVEIIEV